MKIFTVNQTTQKLLCVYLFVSFIIPDDLLILVNVKHALIQKWLMLAFEESGKYATSGKQFHLVVSSNFAWLFFSVIFEHMYTGIMILMNAMFTQT